MRYYSIISGLLVLALLSGILGCNRVKEVILPHTELIFPYEEGNYRVMQVIDTTFNTTGPIPDRYYKKEMIGGFETDLVGRKTRKLEVYKSPWGRGLDFNFTFSRLYTLYVDSARTGQYYVERVEENQRYQILKFPVSENVSWNGNLYNNQGVLEYFYQNVDTAVTVQGITYENCVVVVQEKTDGLIREAFSYEVYAPNIGLIKKFNRTIVNDGSMGEFNPDKSRIYLEEIVDHN
ncbi:MAG: hypothetical protein KDD63_23045 [Bacteroidetes bacterium]|nr:hypothetical protein [Bacteroidota bacterium]MCB0855125.1 hypothetical protein [Bacteroidota bacterium]